MQLISTYWFAATQETSTLRRQQSCSAYSKFSVELSEATPSFQNPEEGTKTYINIFRSLRIETRVNNLHIYLKLHFFVFTLLMVIFNLKKLSTITVLTSHLIFVNP